MITKGTTHDSGGRLATYLITGKVGEHAELWQLKGFASEDIKDAFRSVHVMAAGTRCQQPFFHVQVRNQDNEYLTRTEWERVADRVESKLGLTDQPRAIAFHRDNQTGHEHMHIAWSRIDNETMTARSLPFFKLRLKEVSRELETELGLTPVRSEREGPVMAPSRYEEEQARRLNVALRDVRQTIRDAWECADNGQSFRAALAEKGLTLAKGNKRDFVVIDHEGGMHALGKRVLGHTAAEIRARTNDLNREELPSVEQAREQLTRARANAKLEPPTPVKAIKPRPERDGSVADIRLAYQQAHTPAEFAATLQRNGIRLAVVSAAEARQSDGVQRKDQIVAVDQTGQVHELNQQTTGKTPAKVKEFLSPLDRGDLGSIEATQYQTHLEVSRFIELARVASLPFIETSKPEPTPDWKRMLTDADYRRERRNQRVLEPNNQQHQYEQGRSRERDRR